MTLLYLSLVFSHLAIFAGGLLIGYILPRESKDDDQMPY